MDRTNKSNCTGPWKIEKVVNFTHFCSKTTHINGSITLYISKNTTVIVHIYTVTIVLYLIIKSIFFCLLSTFSSFLDSFSLSIPLLSSIQKKKKKEKERGRKNKKSTQTNLTTHHKSNTKST